MNKKRVFAFSCLAIVVLLSLSLVSAGWWGNFWSGSSGEGVRLSPGEEINFVSIKDMLGTVCELKEGVGLARKGSDKLNTLHGYSITSCAEFDFGKEYDVQGVKISYEMVESVCWDSCEAGNCGTGGTLRVFFGPSGERDYVCSLKRVKGVEEVACEKEAKVRKVLICRGGDGASRDNAIVSNVVLIGQDSVGIPTPFCGDGTCDSEETCINCDDDCGVCSIEENVTCTDSDGGINLYVKGEFSGMYEGNLLKGVDSCTDSLQGFGENVYSSDYLGEGYCDGDVLRASVGPCQFGCEDGACIEPPVCETYKIRVIEDRGVGGTYTYVSLQNYGDSGWETMCKDVKKGSSCQKGNAVISVKDLNRAEKSATLMLMEGGTFTTKLVNKKEVPVNSYLLEFDRHDDDYVLISYGSACGGGNETEQACSDLIEKVKNPLDFFVDDVIYHSFGWNNSYEDSWWIDGVTQKANTYSTAWYANKEEKYYNLHEEVTVFNNLNVELSKWFEKRFNYDVCDVQSIWVDDGVEQKVYVCNGDLFGGNEIYGNSKNSYKQIHWYKNNIFVSIYLSEWESLDDVELAKMRMKKVDDFLNDLKDNHREGVDWSVFNIPWEVRSFIRNDLASCPSDIPEDTCSPCWSCKIEPIVCPPHGEQKQTCLDSCCGGKSISNFQCSPGICAGCLVPRWFGDKWSDNKCIPYGTRFINQESETAKIYEGENEEEVNLEFISYEKVTLTIYPGTSFSQTFSLGQGETIKIEDKYSGEFIYLFVKEIGFSGKGDSKNYVVFEVRNTFSSYCNYDGNVLIQKQDWAQCQNSYECDSNICSGGECTGINQMIKEASRLKGLGAKIVCRILHLLSNDNYGSCVADIVG